MDLKPTTRPVAPNTVVTPGAPAPSPVPAEDPFKTDPPIVPPTPVKKKGGKGKKFLMFLLVLLLLGGVGYGVYYWQHQQVDKLAKENAALTARVIELQNQVNSMTEEETATEPTADELAIAATTAYCQAGLDPATQKAFVYTQGTSGAEKKKVVYATNNTFAMVNAACTATAAGAEGNYKNYYLKLSGDEWVVLTSGQTADAAAVKAYGIPAQTEFK